MTIRVFTAPFPPTVDGAAAPDGDGYIIVIRDSLTDYQKKRTLLHEVSHIMRGDFTGTWTGAIEAETHELIAGMQIADPWNATRRATGHRDAR